MKSLLKKFTTLLQGIAIGIANIIPGVSGGTIAVILNIYDHLINDINTLINNCIKYNIKGPLKSKKELLFLGQIGIGAIIGVILFSKVCDFLFSYYPEPTYFCLIGLIIGSIPVIIKCHNNMGFSPKKAIFFVFGAIPVLCLTILPTSDLLEPSLTSSTSLTAFELGFIAISGIIAAGSMIIPGLSGSLLLLLIGIYPDVIQAISEFNLIFLGTLGIGAIFGLIIISKGIKWCLSHHPAYTYYAILGLIIGSIPTIWPGLPTELPTIATYVIAFLIGIGLSLQLGSVKK